MSVMDDMFALYTEHVRGHERPEVIRLRPDVYDKALSELPSRWHFMRIGEDRPHFVFLNVMALRDESATEPMAVEFLNGDN